MRENYDMPILFISARTSDNDVLTALNIGGDDYIKKPYTLNILLAKVKAILNRYEKAAEAAKAVSAEAVASVSGTHSRILEISENICLDTSSHKLMKDGSNIPLKAMEYKMLEYLLINRDRVISKEEFFQNVWKDEFTGDGTIAVHIRRLREKIEKDPNSPEIIHTVWGVGYIIGSQEE